MGYYVVYFDSQNKIKHFGNPIDYIEEQIYRFGVDFWRDSPNQLNLNYTGQWRSYNVLFNWYEQNEIISVSSHFHYCAKLDIVFFKYHVSVKGFDYLTEEQIQDT